MLITLGVVITTALIIVNVVALADVMENDPLPAPLTRAWLITVILAPGIGAALWFSHRSQVRKVAGVPPARSPIPEGPRPGDLERLHLEIDQFRSPNV